MSKWGLTSIKIIADTKENINLFCCVLDIDKCLGKNLTDDIKTIKYNMYPKLLDPPCIFAHNIVTSGTNKWLFVFSFFSIDLIINKEIVKNK